MKKYLIFLIFIGLSSCIDAQTVKETVRGKYGENLGTAETTIRGGKSVTVYRDKYGQVTRKGTVRGRLPKKNSDYCYGWSSPKSRGK